MGTSLWLVPPPASPEETALQDVIMSISKTHSSPSFPPHITLASLPECVSRPEVVSCLSSEKPLEVSFETVRSGQTFFQSVFAILQHSPDLSNLHKHVHTVLGIQPKTPEFAHLSLYYGNESKEEIIRELRIGGILQNVDTQHVSINGVSKFMVEEVWIVNCQGNVDDWLVMEKVPLSL